MKRLLNTLVKAAKGRVVNGLRRSRTVASRAVVTVTSAGASAANAYRRLSRSYLAARLDAWRAVNAGLHRTDHLTHRLRVYLKMQPFVGYPLPEMRIGADDHVVVTWPDDMRHPDIRALDDGARIEDLSAVAHGARRDFEHAEDEHGRSTARSAELLAQITDVQREDAHAAATEAASVTADAAAAETPTGYEPPPSLLSIVLLRIFQLFLIDAESFLTFLPLANQGGIDVSSLRGEFQGNPWGVAGFAVAACGCACLLFVVADRIWVAAQRMMHTTSTTRAEP